MDQSTDLSQTLWSYRESGQYMDVTLACQDKTISGSPCHGCSPVLFLWYQLLLYWECSWCSHSGGSEEHTGHKSPQKPLSIQSKRFIPFKLLSMTTKKLLKLKRTTTTRKKTKVIVPSHPCMYKISVNLKLNTWWTMGLFASLLGKHISIVKS